MYLPFRQRRGLSIPAGTPRVNDAHPLASSLTAAYLFGEAPVAVLPGFGTLSIKTGTPGRANGIVGGYASFTAISGYSTPSAPSGDFSVVIVAMRAVTAGGGPPAQVQLILSNDNSSGTGKNGFHLGMGNAYTGTPNRPQFSTYVADVGGAAASGWVNGKKETLTGDIGSTDLSNGIWYTLGATYSGVPTGNSGLNFGCDNDLIFALTGGGGIALALFFKGQLPDGAMADLSRDPGQMLLWPDDDILAAWGASSGVSVSLTGIGSTFSAGTLLPTRSLPLTGSAITGSAGAVAPTTTVALSGQALGSAAGTVAASRVLSITGEAVTSGIGTVSVGSTVSVALTGIEIASASGTITPGLAVAIAGSAMTLSAGSLAYSAGFTLAGISTASASGTVGASGGDVETVKALTGLSIAVSPGNVRVTGGTPWVPQVARAIAIATAVGNTLPPPPRLTGDQRADIQAQGQWLSTLYDQLVKVNNVFGRINDHETRIASLEASNDNLN